MLSASGCVKQSLGSDFFEMALFVQGLLVLLSPGIKMLKSAQRCLTTEKPIEQISSLQSAYSSRFLGHGFLFVSSLYRWSSPSYFAHLCTLFFAEWWVINLRNSSTNCVAMCAAMCLRFGIDLGFQQWPRQLLRFVGTERKLSHLTATTC